MDKPFDEDTIDLYEHDDPGPRYKRLLLRLVERAEERERADDRRSEES
jgi:hypothetical protein